MVQRLPLIAALLIVELAVVGGIFIAIRGDAPASWAIHPHGSHEAAAGAGSSYSFVTGAGPELTIDVGYADVGIVTHASDNVDVSIPAAGFSMIGPLAPITASADGDSVHIAAQPGHWSPLGDWRTVTVRVPDATRVNVRNAGNISANGLRAEASFNSVDGTITVDDFAGPTLQLSAANGRLMLHTIVAERLDATSGNGRVEASGLQVRDGRVDSSNGRITLGFTNGADTVVSAATNNGKIRMSGLTAAAAPARAAVDEDDEDDDDDASAKTVRIGAGDGRLDVHASNGNITLSQEG
jgi:hypothetical protein